MKFIGKKIYFLLLLILFTMCTLPLDNYFVDNARTEVCLLYYETKFKDALVKRLGNDLNDEKISVYVDTFNNMDDYNPDNYDVVILLSGVLGLNPLPLTAKYINKHDYKKNIIYFCALFGEDGEAYGSTIDKNKIDVITAASTTTDSVISGRVKKISKEIIKEVLKIIE